MAQPSGAVARGRGRLEAQFGSVAVGGLQGIAAESIEHVHQQQFLVLLLVLQTQFDQLQPGGGGGGWLLGQGQQQLLQRQIHPAAPSEQLGDRRPAEQAPLGPGMAGPHRLVIAVEQIGPAGWRRFIAAQQLSNGRLAQQKLLEKPVGVAEVPLGRAGIGHALEAEVLGLQGGDQLPGAAAHGRQPLGELAAGRGFRAASCPGAIQPRGLGAINPSALGDLEQISRLAQRRKLRHRSGVQACLVFRHMQPSMALSSGDIRQLAYDSPTGHQQGRPRRWVASRRVS